LKTAATRSATTSRNCCARRFRALWAGRGRRVASRSPHPEEPTEGRRLEG
jgi:hypothetical protein